MKAMTAEQIKEFANQNKITELTEGDFQFAAELIESGKIPDRDHLLTILKSWGFHRHNTLLDFHSLKVKPHSIKASKGFFRCGINKTYLSKGEI